MPLLYATILQGSTVLCKYADCDGSFAEMTENLITKIHLRGDHKMTDLVDGDYLLHYICADNKIYLCISDSEFSRDCALKYLGKIKTEFFNLYYLATEEAETALPYESMEKTFPLVMATEMKRCNVNELKNGINKMVIEKVEQINSMAERSKTLQNNCSLFLPTSQKMGNRKRVVMTFIIGLVIFGVMIVYFVTCFFCGGLALSKCIRNY